MNNTLQDQEEQVPGTPSSPRSAEQQQVAVTTDIKESLDSGSLSIRLQQLEMTLQFAAQIAHDFNTLLVPLMSYPEIIRSSISANRRVDRMLRDMETAATQLADLSQDLLALGYRGSRAAEDLDLNALIEHALRNAGLPETVKITRQLAGDLWPVRGSSPQIMRLLANLIRNAADAMRDTGELTARTRNVSLVRPLQGYKAISPGRYVQVEIIDSGCGITGDVMPHVFEPFFSTKKTSKRCGSGLGLSIVAGVVEDHHGYITLQSEPGVGTEFRIYIPAGEESESQEKPIKTG